MSESLESNNTAQSKLAQYVEGYEGYLNSTTREASDDALKNHLVQIADSLLGELAVFIERLEETRQDKPLESAKSADRMLSTIQDSLENPTYGEAPFFGSNDIDESRLEQIYDREFIMLQEADNLAEDIADLVNSSLDETDLEERFLQIHDYIDSFNQALFEREYLIAGDEEM